MLSWLEISTFEQFMRLLGCMVASAAIITPFAVAAYLMLRKLYRFFKKMSKKY